MAESDVSHAADRPKRSKPHSIWVYAPHIWIITSCLFADLIFAFDSGGLLPSPQLILALAILLLFTPLYWLIIAILAAFSRRWKRLGAIICSGIIAFSMTCFTWRFHDEIRFQIMRPVYDEQLAHEKNMKTESWDWDEGSGWYEEVRYVKTLSLAPPPTEEDDQGCANTSRRLGGNFFLVFVNCN